MDVLHPARTIPYDELVAGLERAAAAGLVYSRRHPETGLEIWCYTRRCIYGVHWDEITRLARGLVLDRDRRRVVATPFPKFFNMGEKFGSIPDLPFETFEKVDGSMVTVFAHEGRWWTATKGSFVSDEAKWAAGRVEVFDLSVLEPGTTYVIECAYEGNRRVIGYDSERIVLLAAYDDTGRELASDEVSDVASGIGWDVARRESFGSIADLMSKVSTLPKEEEGFVVRFSDGTRLKVKGAGYRRVHAIISRCTPLALWEIIQAGDDLDALRGEMPEEFWSDFDQIRSLLEGRMISIDTAVRETLLPLGEIEMRDLAALVPTLPEAVRPHAIEFRRWKHDGATYRKGLVKVIRPEGNELEGYVPSYSVVRIMREMEG